MDIASMTIEELKDVMKELGEPAFRAGQLFSWIHGKQASSYAEMTNLPAALRERLAAESPYALPEAVHEQVSKLDGTRKYLFRLQDGNMIESVWMEYHHGNSVCISSQAGCRMGCRFCASTIGGLVRSLTAAEMLGQVYRMQQMNGKRVSNVVIMGSGEPLDNYDQAVRFIRLASCEQGLNISQRNITLSTCGLADRMRRLADEKLTVTLAVSLHAPNDEKRKKLMPVANKYPLSEVIAACRYYFEQTGRRLTFEYALVKGENDSAADAEELAALLAGLNCHVNLIPVNPVRERSYVRSTQAQISAFQNKLEKYGINVTIRREMGADIEGACGQLRRSFSEQTQENFA